jgi:hypothetical protein
VAVEEAPQRANPDLDAPRGKARLDLGKRDVALLGQHRPDQCGMGIGLRRTLIASGLTCHCAAMLKGHLPPPDRGRRAYPEPSRRRTAAQPTLNRSNNPIPQILR